MPWRGYDQHCWWTSEVPPGGRFSILGRAPQIDTYLTTAERNFILSSYKRDRTDTRHPSGVTASGLKNFMEQRFPQASRDFELNTSLKGTCGKNDGTMLEIADGEPETVSRMVTVRE